MVFGITADNKPDNAKRITTTAKLNRVVHRGLSHKGVNLVLTPLLPSLYFVLFEVIQYGLSF